MGLDQYAYARKGSITKGDEPEELAYWRKHPNLHGWMEALYRARGGNEDFNCIPVELTLEDLDRLEMQVKFNSLPETTGFFFGQSQPEDQEDDLEFIAKARIALSEGKTVWYDSWW